MINTKYLLYISTCLLVSGNVQASNFKLTYDSSDIFSHGSALHTQLHTPNELKPIPLSNPDNAVKLAAVCAVGGGGCSGLTFGSSGNSMNLDGAAQCDDEGYVNSCPEGQVKDESNLCPYNASYFKCRNAENKCKSGYVLDNLQCPPGQIQDVTSYTNEAGNTCVLCRVQTCEDGGYSDSITSCQKGTPVSFAFQTCYQDVTDKTCEDMGYLSSEPENNTCVPVTECGKSCQKGCYQPTCEDGGYKSGIPDNNICAQIEYYGNKCFDNCYQPTCDHGGYLDAQPDGQTCTPVTYYGRNCYQNDCKNITSDLPILYSDKTVSNSIISGKTPIGIVFDADKKLAVALDQPSNALEGGGYAKDITSMENCTSEPLSCGTDGKANTAAIIAFGKANNISYPAAEYCYNYTTTGTKAGDWHLPSLAELSKINEKKDLIDVTLKLLGKSSLTKNTYWSSTEGSYIAFWTLGLFTNLSGHGSKGSGYLVRPVINYGTTTTPSLNILYSDMSVSDKIISGKTPIGIVFDDTYGLAIALEDSPSTLAWGGYGTDITNLENCTSEALSCGTDGRANTAAIISFGKLTNTSYPAAEYCDQYTTEGTNAREWHLPSYAELNKIYQKKDQINATLNLLGKSSLREGKEDMYSSSTERTDKSPWGLYMDNGGIDYGAKDDLSWVRPVIAFEQAQCIDWEGNLSIVYTDGSVCENIVPSKTPYALILDDDNAYGLVIYASPKYGTSETTTYGLHSCSKQDENGDCEGPLEYFPNIIQSISPGCVNNICTCQANTLNNLTNGEINTRNAKKNGANGVFDKSLSWTNRYYNELFGLRYSLNTIDDIKGLLYTPSYSEAYTLFLERDRINDRLTELNKYYGNLYTLIEEEPIWVSSQGWDGSQCYADGTSKAYASQANPNTSMTSYMFIHYRDFVTLAQEYQQ